MIRALMERSRPTIFVCRFTTLARRPLLPRSFTHGSKSTRFADPLHFTLPCSLWSSLD